MTPARAALPLRLLVLAAAILGGLGGCDGNSEPATSPIESGPSALTAGTTALSHRNLTVFGDYDNANFGVGNAFNARANVSGTGLILAAGTPATAQVLNGANLPAARASPGAPRRRRC